MKSGIPGLIVAGLLLASGPAAAQALTEFACGRSLARDDAPPQLVMDC